MPLGAGLCQAGLPLHRLQKQVRHEPRDHAPPAKAAQKLAAPDSNR